MEPFTARLKTFSVWAVGVGVAFFGVYPTLNAFTASRSSHFLLFADWELWIPFCPAWIWVYLSFYALFPLPPVWMPSPALRALGKQLILGTLISGAIFGLLPARIGFERVLPSDPFYQSLFSRLFALDLPHNLVPSLHVVYTYLICMGIVPYARMPVRGVFLVWLGLIMASTLLVHQHHVLDIVGAVALSVWMRRIFPVKERAR